MPTYVYEVMDAKGNGTGRTFEWVQPMSAAALTKHPETGEPVRRVPQAPMIAGKWSGAPGKGKLSDANLDRLGFTKYQRSGDGVYEKRAGKGPRTITRD
ncbi:MAG TPA: hypothetical protein PLU35_12080 [Phycisphaerales bacterium]|nr:hypothetical protein [Phycisphaerales bacterium]